MTINPVNDHVTDTEESKLHLVDLAGSERSDKTGTSVGNSVMSKEANYINKSLSYLEQVVIALTNKDNHVPYRQSKLTYFLKDCIGGIIKSSHSYLLPNSPIHPLTQVIVQRVWLLVYGHRISMKVYQHCDLLVE